MPRLCWFAFLAVIALSACDGVVTETPPDGPDVQPGLSLALTGTGDGHVLSSPGGIDCTIDCAARFDDGTVVNLLATANVGSTFVGWGGSCSGASTTCTVTVDGAIDVTATFDHDPVPLVVGITGVGTGVVTSSPVGIDCGSACDALFEYGATVTLTATPADPAMAFGGWSGACSGTGPCTLTMDGPRNVVATYRHCQAAPQIVTATGTTQVIVPPDCGAVAVKMWGGGGGGGGSGAGIDGHGGGGGFAAATFATTPAETVTVFVGAGGSQASTGFSGAGGGGSSALARATTPLLIAGGGGGGGSRHPGGGGGALVGLDGTGPAVDVGGRGGTQSAGGAGGISYYGGGAGVAAVSHAGGDGGASNVGSSGASGAGGVGHGPGGAGGFYVVNSGSGGTGGGGGGGYHGGGGGGGCAVPAFGGGGGGGGSSYVAHPTSVGAVTVAGGDLVAGNNTDPAYVTGTGLGGQVGVNGGAGRVVLVWTTE